METKSDSFAKEVVLCNEKLLDNDLRGSTKRSYSDSELPTLVAALKTGDESVEDSDSKPAVSSPVTQIANKNSNEYKTVRNLINYCYYHHHFLLSYYFFP